MERKETIKLKAGSLYLSIVIALIIGIGCSALIAVSYYSRLAQVKYQRQQRLYENLCNARTLIISQRDHDAKQGYFDLYGEGTDSVHYSQKTWGIYPLVTLRSRIQKDSLQEAFLLGTKTVDDPIALYLADENRPMNISGEARINGNVLLPKSGIRQTYVNGRPFTGKQLIEGSIGYSESSIPALNEKMIKQLEKTFLDTGLQAFPTYKNQLQQSFFAPTAVFKVDHSTRLSGKTIKGNIILISDTSLHIPADLQLQQIQVYAKSISIAEGFKGTCQFFATDSIVAGKNISLDFPSSLVLIGNQEPSTGSAPMIYIGRDSHINGILISYEQKKTALQTVINIDPGSKIQGEVYASGTLQLSKGTTILGKATCYRLLSRSGISSYNNYLVDAQINRKKRNPYYLSSHIFNSSTQAQQVLQWLN